MPQGQNWPQRRPGRLFSRRHPVEVRFGQPIHARDAEQRREVMAEVRDFWERQGRPAQGAPAAGAHDVLLIHRVLEDYEARHAAAPTLRFDKGVPGAVQPAGDRPASPA